MSGTPRSELFDDVYFSADDGPGETAHVFFDGNNLPARWQDRARFTVAETGFGTGLNFLLACDLFDRTAPRGAFLDFISVEKYPLTAEQILKSLSPWADRLSPWLDELAAQYPLLVPGFHRIVLRGRVALTLIFGDANDVLPEVEAAVDAWFLDGFTPSKNPDMWTPEVFTQMARLSADGATLATFTAAGFVKRGLRQAGFHIEKRAGFGRKRDMLTGTYLGQGAVMDAPPAGKIAILGAGLAGTACAYVFRQYGLEATIHDPAGIASGASGNMAGLINPRFTAFRTAQSDFYTAGFALAARTFPSMGNVGYERCGSLHLINDPEKEKRLSRTLENWSWDKSHMQWLSSEEASDVCGVVVGKAALYLPDSGQVDPFALCHAYASGVPVSKSGPDEDAVKIYACGPGTLDIPALAQIPLETVRGQITFAAQSGHKGPLKTNICYGGYISAPRNGVHAIGSTFQKWLSDTIPSDGDDVANLENLAANVPALGGFTVTGHRAALRTASRDRFPIVGPAEGGFVTTAHGSHGLVSTLAAAHLLADYLRGGPFSLGKSSRQALLPSRFIKASLPLPRPHA